MRQDPCCCLCVAGKVNRIKKKHPPDVFVRVVLRSLPRKSGVGRWAGLEKAIVAESPVGEIGDRGEASDG